MGHVEPGGASAGPGGDAAEHPVWPVWRRLTAEFRTSRLLASAFRSGYAWGVYGVDSASSLRRTPMARGAERVLADVDPTLLSDLAAVAQVNVQRNDALWRMAVIFYVTIPVTVLLASLEAAPEILSELVLDLGPWLLAVFVAFTFQMLFYFGTQWRARQIAGVLELIRIEREGGYAPSSIAARGAK